MLPRACKLVKNSISKGTGPFHLGKIFALALMAGASIGSASAQYLTQPSSTPLEDRAAYYIQFRGDIEMLEATPLDSAYATRDAHNRLGSHDATLLSSGWVAYAALVAADTPEFNQSIQNELATLGKEGFLNKLRTNPRAARDLAGSDAAIQAIMEMAAKDATKVQAVGETYISNAYAMQNKGWAKKKISDGTSRVYEAESYANSRARMATPVMPVSAPAGARAPGLSATDRDWNPDWSTSSAYPNANPRATPIMDRALLLAARYAVGDLNDKMVSAYAKNDNSRRCLTTAKLNLNQCIAATRTPYEEAFCLGEHGLKDVSGCLGWVAGAGDR